MFRFCYNVAMGKDTNITSIKISPKTEACIPEFILKYLWVLTIGHNEMKTVNVTEYLLVIL
jgi:hypothetical protein